jgi:hypothetical protein
MSQGYSSSDIFVDFIINPIGKGVVKFHCGSTCDAKRAGIPALYNEVEVFYEISEQPKTALSQLTQHITSSKAVFETALGTQNIGKYVSASCRFSKATDKNFKGPFGGVMSILIN